MNIRDSLYYKLLGIASWIIVPPTFGLLMWTRGPRGFASLFSGILSLGTIIPLFISYCSLLSINKLSDLEAKNILSGFGYPILSGGILGLCLLWKTIPMPLFIWLILSYSLLLIGLIVMHYKKFNIQSSNLLIDCGYMLGLILIVYTFLY